jgi:hypothetical protein
MPMGAPIFESDYLAGFRSVKYNRLSQEESGQGLPAYFACGCGNIPMISEEHGPSPFYLSVPACKDIRGGP